MMLRSFLAALMLIAACNAQQDPFLADWMGQTFEILRGRTLLDIALPGTHDSFTHNLSTSVSDGATPFIPAPGLVDIVNIFGDIIPNVGNFVRNMSKTQGLNVTAQLDSGVRFIDFRVMFSRAPRDVRPGWPADWYSLHFAQSAVTAMEYLAEVRTWMDAHPRETVVIWFSRHGNTCHTGEAQYPNVTEAVKRQFWRAIETQFDGLLVDHSQYPIHTTPLGSLTARNMRLVLYMADYASMTGNSRYALDCCAHLVNRLGGGMPPNSRGWIVNALRTGEQTKREFRPSNRFWLASMSASGPADALLHQLFITVLPLNITEHRLACARSFRIPDSPLYCPETLQAQNQMVNYYNQQAMEEAFRAGFYHFPNAIYIDAVDINGTIRTGTEDFCSEPQCPNRDVRFPSGSEARAPGEVDTLRARYPYAYTVILANVRLACARVQPNQQHQQPKQVGDDRAHTASVLNLSRVESAVLPTTADCVALDTELQAKRSLYPMHTWTDTLNGRVQGWPAPVLP